MRNRKEPKTESPYRVDALEARLLLAAATKVVFGTAPVTFAAGSSSPVITVQLQDAGGAAANAGAGGQMIKLSTSSSGGAFRDAGDNVITTVVVPEGASSATVGYSDTVAATPTLTLSSGTLAAAIQQETVTAAAPTQLAFTTLPSGSLANTNSTTISVTLRDVNGNAASAPVGGLVVNLSSTSAGGTFSSGASVTILANTSTGSFTYRDTIVGTPTITAASAGLTPAVQQQTVYSATTTVVKPDPAGLGSYASTPPGGQNAPTVYGTQYDWIDRPAGSPLPTNDWWTNILNSGFAGSLYAYPQRVFTASNGTIVSGYTGTQSVANNIGFSGEQTILVGGNNTSFTRDALVDYGDWSVRYRMEKAANQYMDVTMVQGAPVVWYEFTNVSPFVHTGTVGSYGSISDSNGASLGNGSVGFTTDRFRFTKAGVNFAVFAPAGTVFVPSSDGFSVAFTGTDRYLVTATLPSATNAMLDTFYQHVYAVPRNTTYGYSYNAVAGAVTTTWDVTTELLKAGASQDIIQGWVPHNYRDIVSGPALEAGFSYPTIQGPIKMSIGHSFTIVQPTNGLNFVLPAPQQIGGASDFDPAKMANWLSTYQLGTGSDSYGGMTTLSQAAQMTLMAQQLNDGNYTRLLNILRNAVTAWVTYQAGDNRFFTYYPKDKALIAYPPAFGAEHYTDVHFHYGYLTSSAAVLAMLDPTWATNYGAILTMVAKSYANWDRSDTSAPWFRTFNPWSGHSYADGLGNSLGNQGNNQESASEAVQSWQGLVLLGQALGNQAMTDAGMMGYTLETKAETEYWLNVAHKDLNPPGYPVNRNTAINADFTRQQQTFFGNQPKYQLGIEGLPDWPSMDFLGKYNQNMQDEIDATMAAIGGADPYATLGASDDGNNWLGVILGMQGQVNPQKAADQFARLATLNAADNVNPVSGIPYYLSHSNRTIGLRDWNYHLSAPVGGVYTNSTTGKRTYVVYNSQQTTQTIQVLNASGTVIDSFAAGARSVTIFTPFAAIDGSGILQVTGTPNVDTFSISQSGSTISLTLGGATQTFDATTINGVVIAGLASDDTLNFNGPITKPVTFNAGSGNNTLNVNGGTLSFDSDASAGSDNLTVNVAAGASAIFNATQHLAALNTGGSSVLTANGGRVLVTKGLSFSGNGKLDLNDNDFILDYSSGPQVDAVQQLIAAARHGGDWLGTTGITSTTAKDNTSHNTTLGAMESLDFKSIFTASALFAGETIDDTAVLVKYTYYGDATFDGRVTFDDYVRIDTGFNAHRTGWSNGDFNLDGTVSFDDYVLIDIAFNTQGVPLSRPVGRKGSASVVRS